MSGDEVQGALQGIQTEDRGLISFAALEAMVKIELQALQDWPISRRIDLDIQLFSLVYNCFNNHWTDSFDIQKMTLKFLWTERCASRDELCRLIEAAFPRVAGIPVELMVSVGSGAGHG